MISGQVIVRNGGLGIGNPSKMSTTFGFRNCYDFPSFIFMTKKCSTKSCQSLFVGFSWF